VYRLKPPVIPEGFVPVQDTREQAPLFNELWVVDKALKHGDYSIKGFEDVFTVERKQMSDLYTYIGKDRKKTTVKMEHFKQFKFVGLVIEASEGDVLAGQSFSKLSPETVRQALVSFEVRYGVHIYYSRNRDDIRRWIVDRAVKFYKVAREVNSEI
jgi:ERCC4-type nuclease